MGEKGTACLSLSLTAQWGGGLGSAPAHGSPNFWEKEWLQQEPAFGHRARQSWKGVWALN